MPVTITITLTDEAYLSLMATADRERLKSGPIRRRDDVGTGATDVINQAIVQYGIASDLPVGRAVEITEPGGGTILITRKR